MGQCSRRTMMTQFPGNRLIERNHQMSALPAAGVAASGVVTGYTTGTALQLGVIGSTTNMVGNAFGQLVSSERGLYQPQRTQRGAEMGNSILGAFRRPIFMKTSASLRVLCSQPKTKRSL